MSDKHPGGKIGTNTCFGSELLRVHRLTLEIVHRKRRFNLLQDINFSLKPGETMAIVGESGSGKTMLARTILGIQPPATRLTGGEIHFRGQQLHPEKPQSLQDIRGSGISMVFQNAAEALNPLIKIGRQAERVLRTHSGLSRADGYAATVRLFTSLGLENPEQLYGCYPHQLSGGMNQRIMIGMAICGGPQVLIADEPTSALDSESREQVIKLLLQLQENQGFAMIFITHNMSLAARLADSIAVMKNGRIIEHQTTEGLFSTPVHAYSKALAGVLP